MNQIERYKKKHQVIGTKNINKLKHIYMACFIFSGSSLFGQTSNLITANTKSVASRYFTSVDQSSYIDLVLYADGDFTYKYKFEAAGIFTTEGKWKRTKKAIVLYDIGHVADRPPAVFERKWFTSKSRICTERNFEKEDAIFLDVKPCN